MEPLGGVIITSREIYDAVVRLTGRVDVLIEQQNQTQIVSKDHESRIRAVERRMWALPSLATLVSVATFVYTYLGGR